MGNRNPATFIVDRLPGDIIDILPGIMVDRRGTCPRSYMKTAAILGYVKPHQAYTADQRGFAPSTENAATPSPRKTPVTLLPVYASGVDGGEMLRGRRWRVIFWAETVR